MRLSTGGAAGAEETVEEEEIGLDRRGERVVEPGPEGADDDDDDDARTAVDLGVLVLEFLMAPEQAG